ncbi:hypothetical protein L2E82_12529 [Cichorium intybus]|uniref:Uncharacterized protein n=1 Tax=Cichorium intybus TaxID=13427 RepID=A0ACB9GGZ0_CICIN|nr:hypothetical protein L2E82_12529 [Cichorium intybus]
MTTITTPRIIRDNSFVATENRGQKSLQEGTQNNDPQSFERNSCLFADYSIYNENNGNLFSDVLWHAALVQSVSELEFGQQVLV